MGLLRIIVLASKRRRRISIGGAGLDRVKDDKSPSPIPVRREAT
jgi:hypothetical protein